jgi:hypothetical protein
MALFLNQLFHSTAINLAPFIGRHSKLTATDYEPYAINHELFPILQPPKIERMVEKKNSPEMFSKANYKWMLIGLVVIAIGMFLMSGGVSNKDPKVFNADAVYSARRITIAPLLILIGLAIEIFAIFKRPKAKETVS